MSVLKSSLKQNCPPPEILNILGKGQFDNLNKYQKYYSLLIQNAARHFFTGQHFFYLFSADSVVAAASFAAAAACAAAFLAAIASVAAAPISSLTFALLPILSRI